MDPHLTDRTCTVLYCVVMYVMYRQYKLGLSSTTNLLLFLPLTLKNPNQLNQHSLYLVFTKGRENISQAVLSVTQSHLHIKLI